MNNLVREKVKQALKSRDLSQADLARMVAKTPQAISRALGGGVDSGSVPPIWQNILETLDLELTIQKKGTDG